MPAALITLPHFCVSACWNLASASGVVVKGSVPLASKNAFAAGLFVPAIEQLVQPLDHLGAGVFAGT